MQKVFKLHEYTPVWEMQFLAVEACLRSVLEDNIVAVHHIGSTSVPGLVAKEDIDILCVVKDLSSTFELGKYGFRLLGELNVPLRYFFKSDSKGLPKVNLHVCEREHGFIKLNLTFRDALRSNEGLRNEYACLKRYLVKNPMSFQKTEQGFVKYTLEKDQFIKSVFRKVGFSEVAINYCLHYDEWKAYHYLKNMLLFQPAGITYDPDYPAMHQPNQFHFVQYRGVEITTVAQVEVSLKGSIILRALVTDTAHQYQGCATQLLVFLERWARFRNISMLYTHADVASISFYQKRGYRHADFDDVSVFGDTRMMGKCLTSKNTNQ